MRKGRSIIISAILTLGTAGSILAGSVAPAIAAPASSGVVAVSYSPNTHFYV
jgi:hypothetical protein